MNNIFLLVITKYNHRKLDNILSKNNIKKDEYKIYSLNHSEVAGTLSVANYGLWPSASLEIDSQAGRLHGMVTGIKTFEYLAAGLPIISNENMTGVKNLIEKYNVGYTFNIENMDVFINKFISNESKYHIMKKNCIRIANNYRILIQLQKNIIGYIKIWGYEHTQYFLKTSWNIYHIVIMKIMNTTSELAVS